MCIRDRFNCCGVIFIFIIVFHPCMGILSNVRDRGIFDPKTETSAYNPYDINCSSLFTEIVFSLHLPILAGTTRVILPPRIFLSCIAALASSHADVYKRQVGFLDAKPLCIGNSRCAACPSHCNGHDRDVYKRQDQFLAVIT